MPPAKAAKKPQISPDSDRYVSFDVAVGISGHGTHSAFRQWVRLWNISHPEGDALHVRRRYGRVHLGDLRRALGLERDAA